MKQLYLLLCLSVASLCLGQSTVNTNGALKDSIEHIMQLAKIPGMSFAQIKDFEVAESLALGVKASDSANNVGPDTVFEAASLTKPLVAYAALRLVEAGRLELDKPLSAYYKYPDIVHNANTKNITARMVLSHTAGFPNWRSNRQSDSLELLFPPNTRFKYSGEGFVYLQKVMEAIAQEDLNTIVKSYVFDPLQMHNSNLLFQNSGNFAVGHDSNGNEKRKITHPSPNAAYSLHTTASDYAKFIMELLKPRFLNKEIARGMHKKQQNTAAPGDAIAWGLGIGLYKEGNDTYVWHWGDNRYFKSFFFVSTKTGDGFTYFANSENGLSIVRRLLKLTLGNTSFTDDWDDYKQL